jgi:pyruvate-formate lyase-activating enzyme
MSKPTTTRFTIDLAADLADAVARVAAANNVTVEELISECVSQHCETALRHRVLIQRQNDVDEALLELARLVGRLTAGPNEPPINICRYHPADAE